MEIFILNCHHDWLIFARPFEWKAGGKWLFSLSAPSHSGELQTFQMRIFSPYNHFRACN